MAMPASSAASGEAKLHLLALVEHRAASRLDHAAIILVSVDLPAPFSPSRAWISPLRRSKSTS